jgi:Mg-chelatase subunit ChlD
MSRPARIHRHLFVSLTLAWIAAAWVGCAKSSGGNTTGTSSTSSSSSSGNGGSGGAGGNDVDFDAGGGGKAEDSGACVTTSAEARRVPLDVIFIIDRSGSMKGQIWDGTKAALTTFFNDPASAGIGAGLAYFPSQKGDMCNPTNYADLDVPIGVLPANAFALTNSMPFEPLGWATPMYSGLKGVLMAATAYQESHPTHKVIVVLATDGNPSSQCKPTTIDAIAGLAKGALDYNGVRTYVIGISGATIANLDEIAEAGGTTAAYDITKDISEFSAKTAEIRTEALGCDFEIPPPPNDQELDPDRVNFTYMPKGMGSPKILPRADDLADCNGQPGWYYDTNVGPTKIFLCPASCATVKADSNAKVSVLFGCNSVLN